MNVMFVRIDKKVVAAYDSIGREMLKQATKRSRSK